MGSADLFASCQLAVDAPAGLGKAMVGGGEKVKRRAHDYYPTPREATIALLKAELGAIQEDVCVA